MSEQTPTNAKLKPKRNYRRRPKPKKQTVTTTTPPSSNESPALSPTLSPAPSNTPKYINRRQRKQPKTNTTSITTEHTSIKPKKSRSIPPSESRSTEISDLIYKTTSLTTFKLANSTNVQKTFRIDIQSESYKFIIPILKTKKISVQGIEDCDSDKNVIRNFNSKCAKNDKSLLFYLNFLINSYDELKMSGNDYKYYDVNKLL